MTNDIAIRCRCGELAGEAIGAAGSSGHRVVCYCDDCQAFAHFLGRAKDTLDARGGTDIFQTAQGRIRIERGIEHLACVRLSERGLLRWYADCCRTPIGNTLASARIPFVGLIQTCIDPGDASLDDVLGPIRSRVFARYAVGDPAPLDASDGTNLGALWQLLRVLIRARLAGARRPSPFMNENGLPRAEPVVLDPAERARLTSSA